MHNWFECKVSYEKMLENGMQKKVTEPYLVDALSFTEAEARIIEEIRPFITGEFTVTDIKRARLSELFFNENGDRFYKIKVYFITLDEKSGAEKKTAAQMLAQATTLKEAIAGKLQRHFACEVADATKDQIYGGLYHRLGNGNPVDGCIPIRRKQYSRREEKWRGTDSGAKTTS